MGKIMWNLEYHKTLQELIKTAQFCFNAMAFHANMDFFLDAATNEEERDIFLAEPVSIV